MIALAARQINLVTVSLEAADEEITDVIRETGRSANDLGLADVAIVAAVVDPEAAVARLVQGEGVGEGASVGDGEADGDLRIVGVIRVVVGTVGIAAAIRIATTVGITAAIAIAIIVVR